jgi:formate--tetrahydrofolate ligase
MPTDIEIAQKADIKPITDIAARLDLKPDQLYPFGKHIAKLPGFGLPDAEAKGKLILVTAVSPTPAGEGKTTTLIGLAEGLDRIGKRTCAVIREPSLGPVFGMKGGAAGGGYSQVLPMEDINLQFTGDFAAVEKAHNLLSAMIDNYAQNRNAEKRLDSRSIVWKRVMDMNDRALRKIVTGLGGTTMGVPREAGFDITAASEIMAILCLSNDLQDLKERIDRIFVGYTMEREPMFARDFKATGAMAALMKMAMWPNLVQTIAGTPTIVHGGPFANIAQGTNTIIGTRAGLQLADYVVTEAGFGADLGAEKFFNIKCRAAGFNPNAVVLVSTIRSLKYQGGVERENLSRPNAGAVRKGLPNLEKHLENMQSFGVPVVIAINMFSADSDEEVQVVMDFAASKGVSAIPAYSWAKGGEGCTELATEVARLADGFDEPFKPTYSLDLSPEAKIETLAKKYYGAASVTYSDQARKDLRRIEKLGMNGLPVCMAKTQYSFSDNPKLLGRAQGFEFNIREVELAAGAGFIVPIAGSLMQMPGLPAKPAAENIDIDANGNITGLF